MKIVFGNATASGNGSLALGADDTDATTYEVNENRDIRIEDFSYDPTSDAFIAPNTYEPSYQPPSPHQSSLPPESSFNSHATKEKKSQSKRSRSEYEGGSTSLGINDHTKTLENLSIGIENISTNFERIYSLMEKRERDRELNELERREKERGSNIWTALKETPNLDDNARYKAADLLNTKVKKDMFLKMSPEERSSWIIYKLG